MHSWWLSQFHNTPGKAFELGYALLIVQVLRVIRAQHRITADKRAGELRYLLFNCRSNSSNMRSQCRSPAALL